MDELMVLFAGVVGVEVNDLDVGPVACLARPARKTGDLHRDQWQQLLATVEDIGDAKRNDERLVEATRIDQLSRPVDQGARLCLTRL